MKLRTKFLSTALGLLFPFVGWSPQAQAQMTNVPNTVIPGQNGAKTSLIYKALGGYPQFLSADARYISGILGGAMGFAYDITTDSCYNFLDFTLAAFISPEHYIGQADPAEPISASFVFYKGDSLPLEKIIPGDKSWNEAFITAVQSNGDRIVTMVYDTITLKGKLTHYNVAAIHNGKTGKLICKLPPAWDVPIDGDLFGFGARADCISGDGTVVGGHSTNPFTSGKWSLAFWDVSDPAHPIRHGLEGKQFDFGSFYGANYDGSVLVGGSETGGIGVIVYYDKANKKFTYKTLEPLPGWDFLNLTAVSDDGFILGFCGMSLDPGTREPIVYTEETGVVKISDFYYEYYDIDTRHLNFYTPVAISRDGYNHFGFFEDPDSYYTLPWHTKLTNERILPRARKIMARAARGEVSAQINWQLPFERADKTLTGYNIYRDDNPTPLNPEPLPARTTTFTDGIGLGLTSDLTTGIHTYKIEALYGNEKSLKAASNTVQVVSPDQCFPVQTIGHRLDYNRYATIYWGPSSSEVATVKAHANTLTAATQSADQARGIFNRPVETQAGQETAKETAQAAYPEPKSYINTTLDYLADIDMRTYAGYAAVKIEDEYYTSSHLGGGITVLDRYSEVLRTIKPDSLGSVMSMYYDEGRNYLYCGTQNDIKILDLSEETIDGFVDIFPKTPARFMAYVPELNDGKGGLIAGSAHSCNAYTMDGELIKKDILDFQNIFACGAAYYKNKLYVSSASGKYYNEIYVYDFKDVDHITLTGKPIQVMEDPHLPEYFGYSNGEEVIMVGMTQAASLTICELEDGMALGAVYQCAFIPTRFVMLELESDESIGGYNIYRSVNGGPAQKLNDAPLTTRRYPQNLDEKGLYTYYVEVVPAKAGAPMSAPSRIDSISISAFKPCPKADFKVFESNRLPILSWTPVEHTAGLVGYNLYRDDTELGRFWLDDLRFSYVDEEVTELGVYSYRLESFYEDGCLSDSTAELKLTGEGVAKEPFALTLNAQAAANDTYQVTARWETPMFEEPMALRYGKGWPTNAIIFTDFSQCMAAVGWNKTALAPYKDLYVVGMEYFIGDDPLTFDCFVILNDTIAYTMTDTRPIAGQWRTVWFDQSFSMDQPKEVAVGYSTTYDEEHNGLLLVDDTYVKSGSSDLVSLDGGRQWSTLKAGGKKGTWCIAALVVHKRQLAEATAANGTIDYGKLRNNAVRIMKDQPLNATLEERPYSASLAAAPSAKAPVELIGFNVYRRQDDGGDGEDKKLNTELLTDLQFVDPTAGAHEYTYSVGAVYADHTEVRAEQYIDLTGVANERLQGLDLKLYPNPASEMLFIEGDFESLQIFDMAGHLRKVSPHTRQLPLAGLESGAYLIRFVHANGQTGIYKIMVR